MNLVCKTNEQIMEEDVYLNYFTPPCEQSFLLSSRVWRRKGGSARLCLNQVKPLRSPQPKLLD